MQNSLTYLDYGRAINDAGELAENAHLLAQQGEFTDADGQYLQQQIPLTPQPTDRESNTRTMALMRVPAPENTRSSNLILAGAFHQNAREDAAFYRYIYLPDNALEYGGNDLNNFAGLLFTRRKKTDQQTTSPPELPPPVTWTPQRRAAYIDTLLNDLAGGNKRLVLAWLAAALDTRRLLLRPTSSFERNLSLVQGLMMLLPPALRTTLSFSTYSTGVPPAAPAIIFSPAEDDGTRWRITDAERINESLLDSPYIMHLAELWEQNILDFVSSLRELDRLSKLLLPGLKNREPGALLAAITARHQQDSAILNNIDVDVVDIINTLNGETAPDDDLRFHYIRRLLDIALESRDVETAKLVAAELDNDPALDEKLTDIFDTALEAQPDAVYVFVRTRLAHEFNENWLTRLHEAARRSLRVAISSGDTPTLISWLELIAREPGRYGLGDILHEGLLTARERVTDDDSALARQLLTLAVRRDPALVPTLLADGQIRIALDETLSQALQADSSAVERLAEESRALFLLAIAEITKTNAEQITPSMMRTLWEMYQNPGGGRLSAAYRPRTLITALVQTDEDRNTLDKAALETLLTLVLAARDEDLFYELAEALSLLDTSGATLATALEQSGYTIPQIITLINTLIGEGLLNAPQTVNICTTLLTNRDWEDSTVPLAEKLARLLHNNPDIPMLSGILWKMLDMAARERSEVMARLALRRLLQDMSETAIEKQLIDSLERLAHTGAWSPVSQEILLAWWRTFTDGQSIGQLQKYERTLNEKKQMEPFQGVIQTTIALRRALGQRNMPEFAEAIATAYSILQALADAFPSGSRHQILLDRETLRQSLQSRMGELSPDVRHVLATNLRELAQLVGSIADNRSKPTLLGPGADDLERALLSGDHPPEGAIDMMKFLSGYIEGGHYEESDQ